MPSVCVFTGTSTGTTPRSDNAFRAVSVVVPGTTPTRRP